LPFGPYTAFIKGRAIKPLMRLVDEPPDFIDWFALFLSNLFHQRSYSAFHMTSY